MVAWADDGQMGAVAGGILLYLAVALGLIAFSALGAAFFRDDLERLALNAQRRGTRNFWLGLAGYVALIALFTITANVGPLKPLVGIVILALLGVSLFAFVIEAQEVGQRIALLRERTTPLTTLLLGALTLELAFLLPILGQIFWAVMLARGLGTWLSSWRSDT